jgi:hypothetical protein
MGLSSLGSASAMVLSSRISTGTAVGSDGKSALMSAGTGSAFMAALHGGAVIHLVFGRGTQ